MCKCTGTTRSFPDGFSEETPVCCTAGDIFDIVDDVWECSAMQELDGGYTDDDVRLAIRRILGDY